MMRRGRRQVQGGPTSGPGVGRVLAIGTIGCAAVVTVAAVAAGGPARIPALLQETFQLSQVVDAVAAIRFYGGVGALVTLSLTVCAGLLAADRVLLGARRRVWAQAAHRTLGVVTIVFLVTHLLTEVIAQRVAVVAAVVPFVATSLYLGLGSIAAYLMLVAMWTGIIRGRFAGDGRPGLWRVLHAAGYLAWPVALLHGLRAGRPPADWVVASYVLLMVLVAIVLGLRLAAERRHRRVPVAGAMAGFAPPAHTPAPQPSRPEPLRPERQYPPPVRPVSGARGGAPLPARPVSAPFVAGPGPARPVSVPVAGRQAPARAVPEPRRRPQASTPPEVPMAVNFDVRRTANNGGPGSDPVRRRSAVHDEVDEHYLAALRGETR